MHSTHRCDCDHPAAADRPFGQRLSAAAVAVVAVAVFAVHCPAQEPGERVGDGRSAVPTNRPMTMPLNDRLRLYNQKRQRRNQPGDDVPRTAAPSAPSPVADRRFSDESNIAGPAEQVVSRRFEQSPGAELTGLSSPSVYVPTQHPNEVVNPGDGPRQASAAIPETIPRTDRTTDPNLLPPPQTAPQSRLSTWQQVQQRGIVFQNSYSRATWLFGGNNKLGMFEAYTQATFGFPLLPGVSFTPSFQMSFLDGPTQTDLPARLYSIQAEVRSLLPIGKSFVLDLSIIPGAFSDFEGGGSDSFRLQGRAIGLYIMSPQSQLVFGVLYLDRFDINVLPTGGWIYSPNADWRFELLFPRPKIGMRLSQGTDYARWGYLAGEFGGDSWAIRRTDGTTDQLVYRDLRLIVGVEQKYANGRLLFLEAGYVFSRQVEYESERGDFKPNSTGMLRAGLIY